MVQIVIANNGHKIENTDKSFSEQKKNYLTKAESQLVSQEFDTTFYSKVFIISKLFIDFGTTEFQTPSRAKKKTDRTRGAMEVDNVAQSDLSTKILVLHLSSYGNKINDGIAFI